MGQVVFVEYFGNMAVRDITCFIFCCSVLVFEVESGVLFSFVLCCVLDFVD